MLQIIINPLEHNQAGFVFISTFVAVSTPKPSLSIVLPCYNPHDVWLASITNNISLIKTKGISFELIIVNDGSTTIDAIEVKEFFKPYPNVTFYSYTVNMGKGYALREGVKLAQGDLIIYTDIDFPYTPESFDAILEAVKHGNDVAIGIRGAEYYTHLPKARIYISKFLRFLIRTMLSIPTDDTQCGLKGFNQRGKEVFLQTTINRYLFDLEFVFLSARNKVKLKTVEVQLREGVQLSTMRMGILLQEGSNFLSVLWSSLF